MSLVRGRVPDVACLEMCISVVAVLSVSICEFGSVSIFRARLCYFVGNAFTCSIRCALAAIAVIVLRLFVGAFAFFAAPQFLACKILITDLHCHELFQTCIFLFVVIVTSG